MSRRNKLMKFDTLAHMERVYENRDFHDPSLSNAGKDGIDMKGRWATDHFKNDKPIWLELACGRGEYTVALSQMHADINYIGVDIKGARIYKGALQAEEADLTNAAFLRTKIELIDHFFSPEEIDGIWITFPDPFLKTRKANRRLTSPPFLDRYRRILKTNGLVNLKTDSDELMTFTREVVEDQKLPVHTYISDVYAGKVMPELEVKTYYERMHLAHGKKIQFISFSLEKG